LRIISGILRGKKLETFRGHTIRPTSDRIREAIFNILAVAGRIQNSVVLDLFAGSGALGIEALSRDAHSAVFVEKNKSAIALLRKNLNRCALDRQAKVIQWDIAGNLDCLRSVNTKFDLVFMDPPYDKDMIQLTVTHLRTSQAIKKEACIVVEHSPNEPVSFDWAGFELTDRRRYGKTIVSFLKYML
jgi:16S rRNA (guanine966-N2)-methyltransferase